MSRANGGSLLRWVRNLWRHISRIEPFKKGVLWIIVLMPLTTGFLYDGMQFGLTSPEFWLAFAVSFALYLTTYVVLMLPFVFIPALSRSGLGKLLAFLTAATAKTVIFSFVFLQTDNQAMALLAERLPGDLTYWLIVWAGIATVSTSNSDYHQSLAELNRVTAELEIQRDKRASAADFADRRLKQLAVTSLQNELEKITHGLRSIGHERDIWRLSVEIKALIEKKVRPLSRELRNRIDLLAEISLRPTAALRRSAFITLRVAPRLDSRFWLSYAVASVNIFITVGQLSNWYAAVMVQAVSLTYPLIGALQSSLWRRSAHVGLSGSIFWWTLMSLLAYLPTLWILNYWARQDADLERIQFTAYLVLTLLLFAFSTWSSHQRVRDAQLTEIEKFNGEIKRELALMDQAVWVAQRKWSYLVHGTVQGALTVASSRLVFTEKPGKKVIGQVIKDVEKAKRALQEAVEFRMGTMLLAAEIAASWEGLCEVDFELPDAVASRLDQNESGRTCFMEISKELVSNAYRHGRATKVWVSAYLNSDGDIRMMVTNNGHSLPADTEPGLGFAMFDELTAEWSFDRSERDRFGATVPVGN